jgi:hypothetical protein
MSRSSPLNLARTVFDDSRGRSRRYSADGGGPNQQVRGWEHCFGTPTKVALPTSSGSANCMTLCPPLIRPLIFDIANPIAAENKFSSGGYGVHTLFESKLAAQGAAQCTWRSIRMELTR